MPLKLTPSQLDRNKKGAVALKPGRAAPGIVVSPERAKFLDKFTDIKLRKDRAGADREETELMIKRLELDEKRGLLVTCEQAQEKVEAAHIEWVNRMDRLVERFTTTLDASEIDVNTRDTVRELLDKEITKMREEIAAGEDDDDAV